jgi:hypothetical protein
LLEHYVLNFLHCERLPRVVVHDIGEAVMISHCLGLIDSEKRFGN